MWNIPSMADGQGRALGSGSIPWCSASSIIRFSPFEESLLNCGGFSYTQNRKEVSLMAKGKYEYWLSPDGLLKLEAWARDGLTDEQIAENMNIVASTLYEWKKRYPEISEALKRNKELVDIEVENALLKKALGFKENIRKAIKVKEVLYENGKRKSEKEHIEYADEEVFVPPDTTAQIFWLKNRRPEQWRDKQDIEHSGAVNVRKVYDEMSEEELMELAKKYEKINSS